MSDPTRLLPVTGSTTSFMGFTHDGEAVDLGSDPFGLGTVNELLDDIISNKDEQVHAEPTVDRPIVPDKVNKEKTPQEKLDALVSSATLR